MKRVLFHPYAIYKIQKRNLNASTVIDAILYPDKVLAGRFGRKIAHKTVGRHTLRVIFEEYPDYLLVITAYPTKKGRY